MNAQELLKNAQQNDYVAHYVSIPTLRKILKYQSIRLGNVTNFNDVDEAITPTIRIPYNHELLPQDTLNCFEYLQKSVYPESLLAACFSLGVKTSEAETSKTCFGNRLAWAHYGDRWHGAALVFDSKILVDIAEKYFETNNLGNRVWGEQVTYIDNYIDNMARVSATPRPIENLSNILDKKQTAIEFREQFFEFVSNYLFLKDKIWTEENEWRLCALSDKLNEQFLPYGEALKAVVFGLRGDGNQLKNIIKNHPNVSFFKLGMYSGRPTIDLLGPLDNNLKHPIHGQVSNSFS